MDAAHHLSVTELTWQGHYKEKKVSIYTLFGLEEDNIFTAVNYEHVLNAISLENLRFVTNFSTPNVILVRSGSCLLFQLGNIRGIIASDRVFFLGSSPNNIDYCEFVGQKLSTTADPVWLKSYFSTAVLFYLTEKYYFFMLERMKQLEAMLENSATDMEKSFAPKRLISLREFKHAIEAAKKQNDCIFQHFSAFFEADEEHWHPQEKDIAGSITAQVHIEEILSRLRQLHQRGIKLAKRSHGLELYHTSILQGDFIRLLSSFLFSRFLVCLFAFYTMLIEIFHSNLFKPNPSNATTAGLSLLISGIYISSFAAIYIFQKWLKRKKYHIFFF